MKWRGYCDGYPESTPSSSSSKPASSKPRPSNNPPPSAKLIHTKKAPLILQEPDVNTVRFANAEQRSYFDEWSKLSINFLSGGLGDAKLWTTTMPQVTLQEPTLRFGAMAVGALRMANESEGSRSSADVNAAGDNKHYLNAIVYYCEALRMQSKARPTREGLRTAMLSSLLFICFEAQRGNMPAALKHVTHGFSMLNELSACSDKAPDLVSMAAAPPALVQEILDCYKPLELQSRSFMGSYRKFFFPPKPPVPAAATPAHPNSSPTVPPASTPPSQPGSPWQSAPRNLQQTPPGLPSPQSLGSPGSQAGQQTPPRPPARGGPPQRPPHIAPFTKHSPYFRPKLTTITKLEDLPAAFSTLSEAHGYWTLLQRQMVQYIPLLTATTSQLALNKVRHLDELEAKLSSVKKNVAIGNFVSESRYWLLRWSQSFHSLLERASNEQAINRKLYLQAINLRLEFLILFVYTALPRFSEYATAAGLTPQYREINHIAATLLAFRPNCGFAMDSGWTWPLFVSAFCCRDPAVRDDAVRILQQYPIRNALRDSRVFRAVAIKNSEVEVAVAAQVADENERWLLLRRRELVFEDLGTNVIYRSAQRNPATGEWELVEEVAPFMVGADGLLDWHRQPISESASILSGVC